MDVLKAKLDAGVRVQKYVKSYRDRANTLEVAAKCWSLHRDVLLLSIADPSKSDFRDKFHALQLEHSPEKRPFYCYLTSAIVRIILCTFRVNKR